MHRSALLLLALVALAPAAAAQAETLASFEEPHRGVDAVWDFTVLQEEAGEQRALIFRNPVGAGMGIVIFDSTGKEIFTKNGSRGIQTLPNLTPGNYRFFVRGSGEFQVTEKAFERTIEGNVSTTLRGADAYVLTPTRHYQVQLDGDVEAEFWDMTARAETLTPPAARDVKPGKAYILTVRGDEGAQYGIRLTPTDAPAEENGTPGLAPLLAVLAVALVARLTRRT